jgi:hypothetical protein
MLLGVWLLPMYYLISSLLSTCINTKMVSLLPLACRENTTFDMNSTFPLLVLGVNIPLQRVTGVLTQVSTGLKLR